MRNTLLCIGLLVLLGSISSASATPKPTKAPSAGAGALTGTTGVGKPTKPTSASGLVQAWQTFKGANVELSLPATYRGGSPDTQGMQRLLAEIKSLGAEYEQIARMVEQNPDTFLLIAVDPTPDPAGGITNVVVSALKVPETVTADAYIDAAMQSLPIPTRTVERKTVQVGQQSAVRLVTEANLASGTARTDQIRQLIYVIKQDNTLWTVTYSTRATDYPQRLALFEQSMESFKV